MEFHSNALVRGIDEAVGVAAEAVHMAEAFGNAALAHDDRYLMQRFRQQRPEIPVVVGAAHAGPRIAPDGAVEIGKAQGIAEEGYRRVVAERRSACSQKMNPGKSRLVLRPRHVLLTRSSYSHESLARWNAQHLASFAGRACH
jgi:hypothetical protein